LELLFVDRYQGHVIDLKSGTILWPYFFHSNFSLENFLMSWSEHGILPFMKKPKDSGNSLTEALNFQQSDLFL